MKDYAWTAPTFPVAVAPATPHMLCVPQCEGPEAFRCFVCRLEVLLSRTSTTAPVFVAAAPNPEPLHLNLVGLRRKHSLSDAFDDYLAAFFVLPDPSAHERLEAVIEPALRQSLKEAATAETVRRCIKVVRCSRFGTWVLGLFKITTDPGLLARDSDLNAKIREIALAQRLKSDRKQADALIASATADFAKASKQLMTLVATKSTDPAEVALSRRTFEDAKTKLVTSVALLTKKGLRTVAEYDRTITGLSEAEDTLRKRVTAAKGQELTERELSNATISITQLREICPNAPSSAIDDLNRILRITDSTTTLRKSMLIAQLAHESNQFRAMVEELDPTKPRPKYFPYYGRGWIQLTWKDNYIKCGKLLKVDLVGNPDLALTLNAEVCSWYWKFGHELLRQRTAVKASQLHNFSDTGDVDGCSRAVNGPAANEESLKSRRRYYFRALSVLAGPDEGPGIRAFAEGRASLRDGFFPQAYRLSIYAPHDVPDDQTHVALCAATMPGYQTWSVRYIIDNPQQFVETRLVRSIRRKDSEALFRDEPALIELFDSPDLSRRDVVLGGESLDDEDVVVFEGTGQAIRVSRLSATPNAKRHVVYRIKKADGSFGLTSAWPLTHLALVRSGSDVRAYVECDGRRDELQEDSQVQLACSLLHTAIRRAHKIEVHEEGQVIVREDDSFIPNQWDGSQTSPRFKEFNLLLRIIAVTKRVGCPNASADGEKCKRLEAKERSAPPCPDELLLSTFYLRAFDSAAEEAYAEDDSRKMEELVRRHQLEDKQARLQQDQALSHAEEDELDELTERHAKWRVNDGWKIIHRRLVWEKVRLFQADWLRGCDLRNQCPQRFDYSVLEVPSAELDSLVGVFDSSWYPTWDGELF